jgi:N4-gp56 family major capsid protein
MAAARLVGINMGRTLDKLALLAAEASSNSLTVDGGAASALAASDVMTVAFLNKIYNKLARGSVPALAEGMYIAVLHDDVIHDLREATGAGSWQDINKYSSSVEVLKNEVGSLGGFRIVRNNHCTITADEGETAVDTYKSVFMGFNALGKAVSKEAGMVMTGPFDKLNRFVNVGWHGVLKYGIVDQDALWVGVTASSVGSNA